MITVVEIPADFLRGAQIRFQLGRRHITSPQPFTAHLRASGPVDTRWIAEITLPPRKRADLNRFDALLDLNDGLAGFFSAFSSVHAYPRGTATGLDKDGGGVPFSDGASFSDGSLFENGIAKGTISAAGARGDEYVTLTGLVADQIRGFEPGDHFAIARGAENYGFLHHAVAVAATDATGTATVRVRPRLREAVSVGQSVLFRQPRGVFRLAEEDTGAFSRMSNGTAQPVLSLVEAPEALLCVL